MRDITFKTFLTEMPHFLHQRVRCPCDNHEGERILVGGSEDHFFDVSAECIEPLSYRNQKKKLLIDVYFSGKEGIVPMVCRADFKVFMWNSGTGETYAPRKPEDIEFCEKIIQAINSPCAIKKNNNDHWDHSKLTILEPHEEY